MKTAETLPSDSAPSRDAVPLGERLTWTLHDLASLTGISVRQLRRLDADRHIPGRLSCGRKVLFAAETVREWVREGMPDRERWEALQRAAQHNGRPR
jgi:predicted DNA-binding transcriptional regulator AlpA